MFVMGNFLGAVARLLDLALWAYMWLIIIRALLSWVNPTVESHRAVLDASHGADLPRSVAVFPPGVSALTCRLWSLFWRFISSNGFSWHAERRAWRMR